MMAVRLQIKDMKNTEAYGGRTKNALTGGIERGPEGSPVSEMKENHVCLRGQKTIPMGRYLQS